jgi:SOS response regulatory protein OraA/RecX
MIMDEIWDAASKFLENRMKTKAQLKKHLQVKEYPADEIEVVLSKFEEYGYINDSDYAAVYISHCIPKGQAFYRIQRELKERGISDSNIEQGLERYIEETNHDPLADELQRGKVQAQKIIGEQTPVDNKLLAKAGRKLVSLGYRTETVYAILGEFMKSKSNEKTT